MDHSAVVSEYLSKMESRELHRLAEKKAKLEYAKLNMSDKAQAAAEQELITYTQEIVDRIASEESVPVLSKQAHACASA